MDPPDAGFVFNVPNLPPPTPPAGTTNNSAWSGSTVGSIFSIYIAPASVYGLAVPISREAFGRGQGEWGFVSGTRWGIAGTVYVYDAKRQYWFPVANAGFLPQPGGTTFTPPPQTPVNTPSAPLIPQPSAPNIPTISNPRPWTSADFANHFLEGSGTPVTLDEAGLTDAVKNADSTHVALGRFESQIAQQAQIQASTLGVGTHTFSYTFNRTYNFSSVAWSIGDATLQGSFGGVLVVGSSGSYTYNGSANIHFYDNFNDPYDIGHVTKIDVNLGGTPYNISGSWTQSYSGSGVIPQTPPPPPSTDTPVIYHSPISSPGNHGGVSER